MSSFVCWISSSSQENYDICKETQQWGIGKNSGVANSHVAKVKKGDKLYIWVGGKGYIGVAESTVDAPIPVTDAVDVPWEGEYSFLLPWRLIKELDEPIYLKFLRNEGQIQETTGISQGVTISGFFEVTEAQAAELKKIFFPLETNLLIPKLKKEKRSTEINRASESQISSIIKGWIFTQKGFRELDEEILNLNRNETKGFQSMAICHYLGLKEEFKGIFEDLEIEKAIELLEKDSQDFTKIIYYLKLEDEKKILLVPDSYVYPHNKKGKGAGESKLYIGNQNNETHQFWGNLNDVVEIEIDKKSLLKYYFDIENEFKFPTQDYRDQNKMISSFKECFIDINNLENEISIKFTIFSGPKDAERVYLKTSDDRSKMINTIIRKVSLHPYTNLQFIKIMKNKFFLDLKNINDPKNETDSILNEVDSSIDNDVVEINKLPIISERIYFTYVTDPELVQQIKSMYSQCQFCNYKFEDYFNSNGDIKQYSEAAHIKPKSKGGLDNLNNILCLCANCHSLFDLGTLYIDNEYVVRKSKILLNKSRYEESYFNELKLNGDHELDISNIKFHRKLTNN